MDSDVDSALSGAVVVFLRATTEIHRIDFKIEALQFRKCQRALKTGNNFNQTVHENKNTQVSISKSIVKTKKEQQ